MKVHTCKKWLVLPYSFPFIIDKLNRTVEFTGNNGNLIILNINNIVCVCLQNRSLILPPSIDANMSC